MSNLDDLEVVIDPDAFLASGLEAAEPGYDNGRENATAWSKTVQAGLYRDGEVPEGAAGARVQSGVPIPDHQEQTRFSRLLGGLKEPMPRVARISVGVAACLAGLVLAPRVMPDGVKTLATSFASGRETKADCTFVALPPPVGKTIPTIGISCRAFQGDSALTVQGNTLRIQGKVQDILNATVELSTDSGILNCPVKARVPSNDDLNDPNGYQFLVDIPCNPI